MYSSSDPFVTDFLLEKELNDGRRPNTMKTYHTAFRILEDNPFVDLSDFSTFTELNFKKLLQHCLIERKWTSHTYNRNLKNWRLYVSWLHHHQIIQDNPLERMRQRPSPRKLPKSLDRQQVTLLLYALNRLYPSGSDFLSERNRAIVYAYLYTGIRLYELIRLKLEDVDPAGDFIRVNDGKGGKDRMVPIIAKLSPVLARYELHRNQQGFHSRVLFPTKYGNELQHREVLAIFSKLRAKLGFRVTPHMLRHTFATELCRKQINLFNISRVLGHSNVNTTKIYLNFDVDSIKDSINGVDLYG